MLTNEDLDWSTVGPEVVAMNGEDLVSVACRKDAGTFDPNALDDRCCKRSNTR
jgi:hypothetical protein